jgi:uncharacterized protein involved in type VI secretion and phage assembly
MMGTSPRERFLAGRIEEAKHTLVLADAVAAHATMAEYESVPFYAKERRAAGTGEHFWSLAPRKAVRTGRHTVLGNYDATRLRPRQPRFGREDSRERAPGPQFEH